MKADWIALFTLCVVTGAAEAQVQHDDYPALAMRMHHEGLVWYHAEYGSDGIMTSCAITSSSGFAELDAQTCILVKRNSHSQPQPPGGHDGSIGWRIPGR